MVTTTAVQVNLQSGVNTIPLPETGMVLKGVSVLGIPYMQIQLTPGKFAVIPLGNASGAGGLSYKDPMFRVHYQFNDLSFIVSVPNAPTSPCIFYFGDPESDSIPLENLTGIVQNVSLSQGSTAGTMTGSINFSFPSGKILIDGIYVLVSQDYAIVNFPVSTGKQLYVLNSNLIGNNSIHPLMIEGSQAFSVNYSAYVPASSTSNLWVVLYYQVSQ
ncbi:MAG: hypothetical protein QW478_10550 [Candidatus Micrarchaeaceae archaeon]